uniref:BZIP domain-containing protein n=1 Tax=Wuchereria bancrofti TaxID=6293 RepID=A0AAF5RVJ7_WUCBA
MTSLSHPLPHFPTKSFLPYDLSTYSTMPHLSHTALMSPLVNPFVPSNILNMFQEDTKQSSGKVSSGSAVPALRPFHIYDPTDPISVLSVPPTTDFNRLKNDKAINEQSPSTQVTSSTSDIDVISTQRKVIVRNETVRKKKELVKDEAYWERRRKNNDAAKRSRDSRRQKEDEMTLRAAMLEQENIRLRLEVEHLRAEVDRLRMLVLSPTILSTPQTIISSPATVLHNPQPRQQQSQQPLPPTPSVTPLLSQQQPSVTTPLFTLSSSTTTTVTSQ